VGGGGPGDLPVSPGSCLLWGREANLSNVPTPPERVFSDLGTAKRESGFFLRGTRIFECATSECDKHPP